MLFLSISWCYIICFYKLFQPSVGKKTSGLITVRDIFVKWKHRLKVSSVCLNPRSIESQRGYPSSITVDLEYIDPTHIRRTLCTGFKTVTSQVCFLFALFFHFTILVGCASQHPHWKVSISGKPAEATVFTKRELNHSWKHTETLTPSNAPCWIWRQHGHLHLFNRHHKFPGRSVFSQMIFNNHSTGSFIRSHRLVTLKLLALWCNFGCYHWKTLKYLF